MSWYVSKSFVVSINRGNVEENHKPLKDIKQVKHLDGNARCINMNVYCTYKHVHALTTELDGTVLIAVKNLKEVCKSAYDKP